MTIAAVNSIAAINNKVNSTPGSNQIIGVTTTQINVGQLVVAILAADNLSAVDGRTNEHRLLNFSGLAMTKIDEFCFSGGAAGEGVTCSVWVGLANAIVSVGGNILALFDGFVLAKACTAMTFSKAAGAVFDIAPGLTRLSAIAGSPGALTIDTKVSGRPHLFVRGCAGEMAGGSWTTDTVDFAIQSFSNAGTTGGFTSLNIGARGSYKIATQASLTSQPESSTNNDWASIGFALYERTPDVGASPKQMVII